MTMMTKRQGNIWQQNIDDARKFRKDNLVTKAKRFLSLYRGQQWGSCSDFKRNDLITVNMVFPIVRNQIGLYYYRNPKLFVKARNDESEVTAPLAESVLNYYWEELKVKYQQRLRIYDTILFGHSVGEIGWRFETDILKKKDKERIYYHEYIKQDRPYFKRISPLRFLFSPEAEVDPIHEAEYVAKESFRSIEDIRNDPAFTNNKKIEAVISEKDKEMTGCKKERYGMELGKLIEVHDRKHMKLLIFADGYEKPLVEKDHPYEDILEGHNFEWLQFNHIPDEPFGFSQVELMEDQQHELNRTRTQMFQHRRRISNRRYIYNEGALSDRQISKLENAEGGALVGVNNMDLIKPLEDARLSHDVPLIEAVIKQDIRELTGLPASQFGVVDTKSRSATEHNQIDAAKQGRSDDNLALVEEDTRNVARKLLQIIQAFSDKEDVVKIVGPKGYFWKEWTKEDIQGEYSTHIDPGSTTKESQALRVKQSADLLALLKDIPGVNKRRLIEDTLKAFDRPRVEEYFNPGFDQMHGGGAQPNPGGQQGPGGKLQQEGVPNATKLETDARQLRK